MRVLNTGTQPVTINLRDGRSFIAQPGGPAVDLRDSDVSMLDDSAFLIGLFNAGTLVAQTDAGAAFPGFPTIQNAADAAVGKLLHVRAKVEAGGKRSIVDEGGSTVSAGASSGAAPVADWSRYGLQIDTGAATIAYGPSNTGAETTEKATLDAALVKSILFTGASVATDLPKYFDVVGEPFGFTNTGVTVNARLQNNAAATSRFDGFYSCVVDSDDFAIIWRRTGASVGQAAALGWLKINGKLITADQWATPNVTVAQSVNSWLRVTQATRKPVLIEFSSNSWLREIRLKNNYDTIRPPTDIERMLWVGDSFQAMNMNAAETSLVPYHTVADYSSPSASNNNSRHHRNLPISTAAAYASNILGLRHTPIVCSVGGTGFFSTRNVGGTIYGNYLDRLQIFPVTPGIRHVHMCASSNDLPVGGAVGDFLGAVSSAAYQARVEACIVEAKRINPSARVTVSEVIRADAFDPRWTPTYTAPMVPLLKAACAAQGAIFVAAGASAPDGSGVISGTGRYGAPNGTGNSDRYVGWDGTDNHPNSYGFPWIGAALGDLIAGAR